MFLESFFRTIFSSDIFGSNSIFKYFLVVFFLVACFIKYFLGGVLLKIVL